MSMVYPRVCGGTTHLALAANAYLGLSPRVRGNLVIGHVLSEGLGSIPACAGNLKSGSSSASSMGSIPACAGEPPWSNPYCTLPPVYPRVCGGTA